MTHYGIIGSGTCGENIIEDGLSELGVENNVFLIYPRKGASPSEDRVYDYMLDNEAEYIAYVKSNAPKVLVDNASKVFDVTGDDAWVEILNTLKSKNGVLLMLWDSDNEENCTNIVFKAMDMGIEVKELSNGLAPYFVEAPVETPDIQPFSDEELRSMSIGVLRKAATAQGIEAVGSYAKEELVEMLSTGTTNKSSTSNPIGNVEVTVTQTTPHAYGEGSITWLENGTLYTKKMSTQEVAWAIKCLQELPTS